MWSSFKLTVRQSLEQWVPALLAKPNGKQWITRDLIRLIRQRDRAYKLSKRGSPQTRERHQSVEAELAKQIKREIRVAKSDYIDCHLTSEIKRGNTKPIYSFVSQSRGRSNKINDINSPSGAGISDALAEYFESVFVKGRSLPTAVESSDNTQKLKIDIEGVRALLLKLDVRKANGPDDISTYTINFFAKNVPSFTKCIQMIFDKSVATSAIPKDWKCANITPIYKGGDRRKPDNYRPISLTSVLSKVLEHILVSQMWLHITENEILSDKQHTTTQLLHVTHNCLKSINNREGLHVVSFDFSKAFDKVSHPLLISKLHRYKFPIQTIKWVEEWLSNRTSVVVVNGDTSKEIQVTSGVPQGSVLGPLLFLIYVNDLTETTTSDLRLYADDALLYSHDTKQIQDDINSMYKWAQEWQMSFNPSKCAHLQINHHSPNVTLYLGKEKIPQASKVKYLGVTIDNTLKWDEHVTTICRKAKKHLCMIQRCILSTNPKTKKLLFDGIVLPQLEYASQVWSPASKGLIKQIDGVHRKGIRWIYHLERLASVSQTMKDHDILSLEDRRHAFDIHFLGKIECGMYDIQLKNYLTFHNKHNTRRGTINPHYTTNQFKNSYYNRMRQHVKLAHNLSPQQIE